MKFLNLIKSWKLWSQTFFMNKYLSDFYTYMLEITLIYYSLRKLPVNKLICLGELDYSFNTLKTVKTV